MMVLEKGDGCANEPDEKGYYPMHWASLGGSCRSNEIFQQPWHTDISSNKEWSSIHSNSLGGV